MLKKECSPVELYIYVPSPWYAPSRLTGGKTLSICPSYVLSQIVDQVKKEKFDVSMWKDHPLNPKTSDQPAVDW